jgi:hypothetical protein
LKGTIVALDLKKKLGGKLDKALKSVRGNETKFDTGGSLPAGIENGIAQLVDIKFDTYKKGDNQGEVFFYAAGVVLAPTSHEGRPIQGLRTSIIEPMHDTPNRSRKTLQDHLDWVCNQLRLLGVETADMEADDLELAVEALKAAKPTFRFRTWMSEKTKEFPNPRLNEVWQGVVAFTPPTDDGVEDETDGEESDEDEEAPAPAAAKKQVGNKAAPPKPTPGKKTAAKKAEPEGPDLTLLRELAEQADGDQDEEAAEQIGKAAESVGIPSKKYNALPSWGDVVDLIEQIAGSGGGEEPAESAGTELNVGDTVQYTPPGEDIPEDCEVLAINEKRQIATIKSLVDEKTYKGISIAALMGGEE